MLFYYNSARFFLRLYNSSTINSLRYYAYFLLNYLGDLRLYPTKGFRYTSNYRSILFNFATNFLLLSLKLTVTNKFVISTVTLITTIFLNYTNRKALSQQAHTLGYRIRIWKGSSLTISDRSTSDLGVIYLSIVSTSKQASYNRKLQLSVRQAIGSN